MTTTRTTTLDDRMAALEVNTHGLQRQLMDQREELSSVGDAMAALTDAIAQLRQDNNNRGNHEGNNEGESGIDPMHGGQNSNGRGSSGVLGGNNGGVLQPRFARLDFPRFSGEDPTGWIYIAEQSSTTKEL